MTFILSSTVACFILWLSKVAADCESYGSDYVDDGSYFINTNSPDYFSFGTEFFGCTSSDTQGGVVPILIDPDENEYFCSLIGTDPDGANQVSYCNVTGNEVLKSQMYSGDWIVVIEGLDFAWMRTFSITAGPQVTVTLTPSVTFSVTTTPSTTINVTITDVYPTTLPPSTITVPSTTITKTTTKTPPKVTVTTTITSTRTRKSQIFSKTWETVPITSCQTQSSRRDPTCTIHPTKGSLPVSSASATSSRANTSSGFRKRVRDLSILGRSLRRLSGGVFRKRDLDQPTITTVETTFISSIYTTLTALMSTEIDTFSTTVTSTITPPPVTAYSGKARTTVTVTRATPTRTVTTKSWTTIWTTTTIWGTLATTTTEIPSGVICKPTP